MTDAAAAASGESGDSSKPGGKQSGAGSEPGAEDSGARTFTQEQVDRVIERRLARFADYDELKSKLNELQNAGATELEKANAKAQEADGRATKATARADGMLIRSAITAEAARAGAVDPDVVVALLVDQFTVENDDVKGDVPKAVAKLLESRPYLKATGAMRGVGSADGGRHSAAGKGDAETPNQRMDDVLRSAR